MITGATGHFGAKATQSLLAKVPPNQVAVSVRAPEKAVSLRAQGVDVRHGDFDDPALLETAFAGVDRMLIVSTDGENADRIRQHLSAVAAAKSAGVRFLAYTSIAKADSTPLSLGDVHRTTEAAIRATGIPFSFLRNNWYLENEIGESALSNGVILTSAGTSKVGWAARDDYAEAAAAVVGGAGHDNSIYELGGPLRTYDELGAVLSQVLGRQTPVRHVDDANYEAAMSDAGLPPSLVSLLVDIQASIRKGALDVQGDDLAKLIGRSPTPLSDAIKQIVAQVSHPLKQPGQAESETLLAQ